MSAHDVPPGGLQPKSDNLIAFEAALDAATRDHERAQAARRAKRRPIGAALLLGGLVLGVLGIVTLIDTLGAITPLPMVYGIGLIAVSVTTTAKGISMLAGRL